MTAGRDKSALAPNPTTWEQRKLGEIVTEIVSGRSVNSEDRAPGDADVCVLKTSCVSSNRFNPSERKVIEESERGLAACPVEPNTIIVSRMNTPDRVGACGYVAGKYPNLYLPDRLWRLKFLDAVDVNFIYTMLTTNASQELVHDMASGTSGSMYNIAKSAYLSMQVTVPADLAEQHAIGTFFARLDNLITLHQREFSLPSCGIPIPLVPSIRRESPCMHYRGE
ncbi:MAG: restriction endonuclease subunit S [Parafannyhessea umbonata]|uniref:restriction endonuclease subunit S n=1 Tax=Parafannyhessea umbonata TaxID=604330 RepID=UPI0026F10527|nr:restriction endonuclease subunit S [Parafannyhessea umbonata]MDD6358531.1 restriction endonuclease subunit S [Parafannyhessea umbonata]